MKEKIITIIFIIILLISAYIKIQFLYLSNEEPLSGDAPGFLSSANSMNNFYACSSREPLWILWTKTCSSLTRNPETGMRLGNIIFSLLSGVLIYIILYKTLGSIYAFSGAAFFLFIPYLFYSPIRAHRLEMYLFLLLVFTYLVLFKKSSLLNSVVIGIISSLSVLVRMESIIVIIPGIIWFTLKKSRYSRYLISGLILIPLITLSGPFFYNCYREKGSPLYILNSHSKFYARHEKAVIHKVITEEQALKGLSGETGVTLSNYIFIMHSFKGIIKRFFLGYIEAIIHAAGHLMSTPVNLSFLMYPVWLGMLSLLVTPRGRVLLFWGLLYVLPHSFILSTRVAGFPSTDIRFAASITPLMAFSMAGFCLSLNLLIKFINSRA